MASAAGEADERTQIRGEFEELQRQYKHMEAMKKVRDVSWFGQVGAESPCRPLNWIHSENVDELLRRRMQTRAWGSSRSRKS